MKKELIVHVVPALKDNYVFLVQNSSTGEVAAVDPGDEIAVVHYLKKHHLSLNAILLTHHHFDHVGAVIGLKEKFNCSVWGSKKDSYRLPTTDHLLEEGDQVDIANSVCMVLEIPGHTSGHIAYWFSQDRLLFCGDTLFSLGCGRLFEGTPEQMWKSLLRIASLPDDTLIYCAHEYTKENGLFALSLEPDHSDLQDYLRVVDQKLLRGQATIPTLLGREKKLNPFLNPLRPAIQRALGIDTRDSVFAFTKIRKSKDQFQSS